MATVRRRDIWDERSDIAGKNTVCVEEGCHKVATVPVTEENAKPTVLSYSKEPAGCG